MIWLTAVFLFSGTSSASYAQHAYRCDGWSRVFCDYNPMSMERQSPIDLDRQLSFQKPLQPLLFVRDVDPSTEMILENDGSKVQLTFPEDRSPLYMEGGPLEGEVYRLIQIHFHWGPDPSVGSEHTLSGESRAAEAHLVHYNIKYGSFENAEDKSDGLAVLGVFGETGKGDNPELRELVSLVPVISNPNSTTVISAGGALDWLDAVFEKEGHSSYFTYPGSLTTPPFTENVIWIVFPKAVRFSNAQIMPFRNTLKNDFTPNRSNFREIQPINGRPVIYTKSVV